MANLDKYIGRRFCYVVEKIAVDLGLPSVSNAKECWQTGVFQKEIQKVFAILVELKRLKYAVIPDLWFLGLV
jgi:hypothetical protein